MTGWVDLYCSHCGTHEGDTPNCSLVEVSVITAEGEEGFAYVTQLLCDEENCLPRVLGALHDLGFVNHHHGSIDFLEDPKCCNGRNTYEDCPTPTGYGRHYVQ